MTPKTYRHLSQQQRYKIEALVEAGHNQTEIATILGVSKSTVSRELARNSTRGAKESERYRASNAQKFATRRAYSPPTTKSSDPAIIRRMSWLLKAYWSPQQIAATCARRKIPMLSTESIYRWIYGDRKVVDNTQYLRRTHRKKRKRRLSKQPRTIIRDRVPIGERPRIVELQQRYGDLEADLVKCTNGYIVTITERKSLYNLIRKVPDKKAETVKSAIVAMLTPIKDWIHTLTSDNGTEFARHVEAAGKTGLDWYFADAYCSQQRGCNENQNGLLRQYLKRNTDLSKLTDLDIKVIQDRLNRRPRKKNNYLSPNKILLTDARVALVS